MSASDPSQQPSQPSTPPPVPPPAAPGVTPAITPEQQLRHQAEKSIAAKNAFMRYLGVWAIVSIMLVVIWAFSGRGYFWPAWGIMGMGIAAFFMALGTYGPRSGPPSEKRIQDEMRRMQ